MYKVSVGFSIQILDGSTNSLIQNQTNNCQQIFNSIDSVKHFLEHFIDNISAQQEVYFESMSHVLNGDVLNSYPTPDLTESFSAWGEKWNIPSSLDDKYHFEHEWFLELDKDKIQKMYEELVDLVKDNKINLKIFELETPTTVGGFTAAIFSIIQYIFFPNHPLKPVTSWQLNFKTFDTPEQIRTEYGLPDTRKKAYKMLENLHDYNQFLNGGFLCLYFSTAKSFNLTPLVEYPGIYPYSLDYLGKLFTISQEDETMDIIVGQILDALYPKKQIEKKDGK